MAGIIRPQRVYVDTNHLIRLRELIQNRPRPCAGSEQDAYSVFLDWIRNGDVSLVFYRPMVLEWAENQQGTRSDVDSDLVGFASIFEQSNNVVEIEMDNLTYKIEILDACRQFIPSLKISRVPIVRPFTDWWRGLDALSGLDPAIPRFQRTTSMSSSSYRVCFREIASHMVKNAERARERTCGFRESAEEMLFRIGNRERFSNVDIRWWVENQLDMAKILGNAGHGNEAKEVLAKVDFADCPAVLLWTRVYWHYLRSKTVGKICDNDADDYSQVHIPAYVDVMLTEKSLRAKFHQADSRLLRKVFSNMETVVEHLRMMFLETA